MFYHTTFYLPFLLFCNLPPMHCSHTAVGRDIACSVLRFMYFFCVRSVQEGCCRFWFCCHRLSRVLIPLPAALPACLPVITIPSACTPDYLPPLVSGFCAACHATPACCLPVDLPPVFLYPDLFCCQFILPRCHTFCLLPDSFLFVTVLYHPPFYFYFWLFIRLPFYRPLLVPAFRVVRWFCFTVLFCVYCGCFRSPCRYLHHHRPFTAPAISSGAFLVPPCGSMRLLLPAPRLPSTITAPTVPVPSILRFSSLLPAFPFPFHYLT